MLDLLDEQRKAVIIRKNINYLTERERVNFEKGAPIWNKEKHGFIEDNTELLHIISQRKKRK